MPFIFECPNCARKIRTADQYAGMSRKCPECQLLIEIPMSAGEPATLLETIEKEPDDAAPLSTPELGDPSEFFAEAPQSPQTASSNQSSAGPFNSPTIRIPGSGILGGSISAADIGEFLAFRRFAAPLMVQLLFWGGVLFIVLGTGRAVLVSLRWLMADEWIVAILWFISAMVGGLFSIVGMRIVCEMMVLMFRIYDQLRTLVKMQDTGSPEDDGGLR